MSDESVKVLQNAGGDRLIDGESVSGHIDGTAFRQRIQLAGTLLAEVAALANGSVATDAYGLVTRSPPAAVVPAKFISVHLTSDGIAHTGSNGSATGNYATVQRFWRGPAVGKKWVISRLLVTVEDSGSFDSGNYGNGVVLTNGISVQVWDGSNVDLDLTDSHPIKTNVDYAHFCYDVAISSFGVGNEYLNARWTFAKAGKGILLDGDATERIAVALHDDFTGLVDHHFLIQGYEV